MPSINFHLPLFIYSGLILLKMLSEYVDISICLPALSSEVIHCVVEILKLFNTRTCQLVLGAGAMQVKLFMDASLIFCPIQIQCEK